MRRHKDKKTTDKKIDRQDEIRTSRFTDRQEDRQTDMKIVRQKADKQYD